MSGPILEVDGLRTWFQTEAGTVKAVDGVSFTIPPRRVLAMVGESGCGKSVTGFSIMGLVSPPGRIVGGRIMFAGHDLVRAGPRVMRRLRGAGIGMIFQDPTATLNPVLRIGTQMVEAILAHSDMSRSQARSQARDALGQVGIPAPAERLDAYPHEFSGGMRQRVVIAMALLHRPQLVIADEPTTALDVTVQAGIIRQVRGLIAELGTSLLWITHDLSIVASFADDLAVMYAGRIVETGPAQTVLQAPAHPYTAGLLASLPERTRRGARLAQIPGTAPVPIDLPEGCAFVPRCARATESCQAPPPTVAPAWNRSALCRHPIDVPA